MDICQAGQIASSFSASTGENAGDCQYKLNAIKITNNGLFKMVYFPALSGTWLA